MMALIITKLKIYKQMTVPILVMTGMAILFTYIFGIGFSGEYTPTVYIADEDQSEMSQRIVEQLLNNSQYSFVQETLEKSKINSIEIGGIGVIHIEEGFEESLLELKAQVYYYKQSESVENMTITNILEGIINEVVSDVGFSNKLSIYYQEQGTIVSPKEIYNQVQEYKNDYTAIVVTSSQYESDARDFNSSKHYFAGFMLFFSLFVVMFGIGVIIDEKEYHVFDRISISPLSTFQIIIANIIVNFFVGMAQLGLVILVGKYVLGLDLGGNVLALLAVLSMYVMTGTAMGLFVTVFIKNQQQLGAILPTLIVSTSMLGGCMWPLEIISNKTLLLLSNFTPQKWAMEAVKSVIIYNGSFPEVSKSLFVLLIITIAFSIATIIGYNKVSSYQR